MSALTMHATYQALIEKDRMRQREETGAAAAEACACAVRQDSNEYDMSAALDMTMKTFAL